MYNHSSEQNIGWFYNAEKGTQKQETRNKDNEIRKRNKKTK